MGALDGVAQTTGGLIWTRAAFLPSTFSTTEQTDGIHRREKEREKGATLYRCA